tara:strand:+ start:19559 stop:19915 length:357 start_codon:yes stop_codon:yes gene_type:complete
MNSSVFNIEPDDLIIPDKLWNYDFDFLNDIFDFDIKSYYNIILSREIYKLKNLYNYLYLRILKINRKFPEINLIENNKYIQSYELFNEILKKYIHKDKIRAIIIMNTIQQFYIPLFNQ